MFFRTYIKDLGTLMCPTKKEEVPAGCILLPCYDYGASSDSVSQFGLSLFWPTRYDIKKKEREFFGDAVSIVRCNHHPEPLHLSLSGEIYKNALMNSRLRWLSAMKSWVIFNKRKRFARIFPPHLSSDGLGEPLLISLCPI